jgi:hypothetical protein
VGADPDGVFATLAVSISPQILTLSTVNGLTEAIGFDFGPLALNTQDFGDLGYTVSLLPDAPGRIVGALTQLTGSVSGSSPNPPFPAVESLMSLCSTADAQNGCTSAATSIETVTTGTGSNAGAVPYPFSYVSSATISHLNVSCATDAPVTCQANSAGFYVVVTPESSAWLMTLLGCFCLAAVRLVTKT